MSNLDEISLEIGKLRADNEEAKRQRDVLFNMLREVNEKLSDLPTLNEDIKTMKPHINDFKKLKNRGIGLLIGVTLAAGGAGAAALKYLQSFTSSH